MNHPTDNIKCGTTILRYYSAYGGWLLPDKTFTKNPLKAQRIAEETEAAKEHHKMAWELYEIEFVLTRRIRTSARSMAKKLDRTVSDVKAMLNALSASN